MAIQFNIDNHIAMLTLDRPAKLNALTVEMLNGIERHLDDDILCALACEVVRRRLTNKALDDALVGLVQLQCDDFLDDLQGCHL